MEIASNNITPLSQTASILSGIETILTKEALKGLDDIASGRTRNAEDFLLETIARRAAAAEK